MVACPDCPDCAAKLQDCSGCRAIARRLRFVLASARRAAVRKCAATGTPMRQLKNHGSTCYLNALLQAMTGLERSPTVTDGLAGPFFDFCRREQIPLATLVRAVTARMGRGQQDAHDLWVSLADELYESDRPLFHGLNTVTVLCGSCGHRHCVDEAFGSLEVKHAGGRGVRWDLTGSLHALLRREALDDYRCDGCREVGSCTRSVRVKSLPEVLVMHVARFEYGLSGGAKKVTAPFTYPHHQVDFRNVCDDPRRSVYRLHAVVDHYGQLGGGHYVCRRQDQDGVWHTVDDDRKAVRTDFKPDAGLATDSSAYMLVYQRL